jgi:hypothetical protein
VPSVPAISAPGPGLPAIRLRDGRADVGRRGLPRMSTRSIRAAPAGGDLTPGFVGRVERSETRH